MRLAMQEAASRQFLPDMLPGNSPIDRVELIETKPRQMMAELGNRNTYRFT
jgi:hypothetical protein